MRRSLSAYWLGRVGYEAVHRLQAELVEARHERRVGDVVLLLEHDAVITLGRSASPGNVLANDPERAARGIELVETGRGGDVTFHGPGQLVAYPIIDLKPDRCDVRRYIGDLAEVMIRLAHEHGIAAGTMAGDAKLIGVWADEANVAVWDEDRAKEAAIGVPNGARLAKLGAIGVRLSRWITMHGFAINVSTDLSSFGLIVPCGIRELDVTSLQKLGVAKLPTIEEAAQASLRHFAAVLDAEVSLQDPAELERFGWAAPRPSP